MRVEVKYTRKMEGDDFFDAGDKARETIESSEEIIAVNPWLEDPEEDLMT